MVLNLTSEWENEKKKLHSVEALKHLKSIKIFLLNKPLFWYKFYPWIFTMVFCIIWNFFVQAKPDTQLCF